ncbi:MAG: lactate utilization protein, partial [Anaerolineales bacterium]|nr:lactate utilization protein [Anaerolineales bacterium]
MPSTLFKHKIRAALSDRNLQAALDKNAEQRLRARSTAYASIEAQLPELRQRAHQVRARVVADLDGYLQVFIQQAQANGLIIHRAANAQQACQIVLQIAQEKGARLIAKSKSMISEEIGLNAALQSAGIQAVETDLGEYIVQLRDEPPSHIVTPAVHLRRADVGQTFHEKLGIPLTEEISTLTDAARASL